MIIEKDLVIENSLINTETLEKNKAVLRQKMTAFAAIFDLVFDYHALPSTETGMSPFSSYFEDFIHFMTDIQQLIDATLADKYTQRMVHEGNTMPMQAILLR